MSAAVTVVIPAWDLPERELADAVESVRGQDEPAVCLVVDNASSAPLDVPAGAELLRLEERRSVGAARNAGLARVATPYVLFLDADDRLLPGTLAFLRATLEPRSEAVMAAGAVIEWHPATGERRPGALPRPAAMRLQGRPGALALVEAARHSVPVTGAALHRSDHVRASGGYGDSDWGEDWRLALATILRGPVLLSRRPCKLHRLPADRESLVMRGRDDRRRVADASAQVRALLRSHPGAPRLGRLLQPTYRLLHQATGRRIRGPAGQSGP
jgi:glycosyltransferase involved in cell wall biosynthesis